MPTRINVSVTGHPITAAMKKYLLHALLFFFGLIILTCLVTLMVVFTGGSFTGADLNGFLLAQTIAMPVALLIIGIEVAAFVRLNGWSLGLALLWRKIPAWRCCS